MFDTLKIFNIALRISCKLYSKLPTPTTTGWFHGVLPTGLGFWGLLIFCPVIKCRVYCNENITTGLGFWVELSFRPVVGRGEFTVSRWERIIIIRKPKRLIFDQRTVYKIIDFPIHSRNVFHTVSKFSWKSHKNQSPFFADPLLMYVVWPPSAAIIASMTFGWISIASWIFSWLRFSNEGCISFMKPLMVYRDCFHLLNLSYTPPIRFFQVTSGHFHV